LRQKGLEAAQELAFLEVFREKAARHGRCSAVNDRADLAYARARTSCTSARTISGRGGPGHCRPGPADRRSSHAELETAAEASAPGVDYFCTGPVWPTPTKPGRPAPGLPLVRYAAALDTRRPWFAIGGITLGNLNQVLEAGARRVWWSARSPTRRPSRGTAAFAARCPRPVTGPAPRVP